MPVGMNEREGIGVVDAGAPVGEVEIETAIVVGAEVAEETASGEAAQAINVSSSKSSNRHFLTMTHPTLT